MKTFADEARQSTRFAAAFCSCTMHVLYTMHAYPILNLICHFNFGFAFLPAASTSCQCVPSSARIQLLSIRGHLFLSIMSDAVSNYKRQVLMSLLIIINLLFNICLAFPNCISFSISASCCQQMSSYVLSHDKTLLCP